MQPVSDQDRSQSSEPKHSPSHVGKGQIMVSRLPGEHSGEGGAQCNLTSADSAS